MRTISKLTKGILTTAILLLAGIHLPTSGHAQEMIEAVTVNCAPAPTNLIGWWRAEGNANDAVGANNGTPVNGVTYAAGKAGQAFGFNGSSYVQIPSSANLNPTGSFSIETWIYPQQDPAGEVVLVCKWGDNAELSNQRSYDLALRAGGELNFAISDAAHQWDGTFHAFHTDPGVVTVQAWNHVVAVYDQSTGTRRVFVNGVQVKSRTDAPVTIFNGAAPLTFGAHVDGGGQITGYFNGLEDEVSLYSRALSAGEVQALYLAGSAGKCPPAPPGNCDPPPSGLISWWQAESNAADAVGGNNGDQVNGATFAPGKVGQALSLNGVNQYVSIPDSPSLRPTNLTIEGWVNFSATSNGRVIALKTYGTGRLDSYALWYDVSGQLAGAVTTVNGEGPWLTYAWTPILGTWHHVAYTFDSASSAQALYLDGAVVANGTVSSPIAYDTRPFQIGADIENGVESFFFGGLIDDVALFNRALSASEIAAIYSAGASGKCIASYPPVVTLQPTNRTVVAGEIATFSVGATGAQPLSYQWRLNGTNLDGATGSSFTLAHAQSADAGLYSALLANGAGTVLSSNALLTVNPPLPCTAPPSGLVSWWQAEGNASDVLGTNNGTVVNGATFAPGRVGRAFSLNGVNQYISVPDSPSLRPTNLTVEGWINFSTLSGGARCIFEKPYGTAAADSFSVVYYAGQLIAAITRASGEGTWLTYNWTPVLGTWHHVAYTFNNGSSTQVLYVDGAAVASGAVSGPIIYDANPFLIGADIQTLSPCFFFGGLIDEAALFNRALSASEIAALYSAGASGKCTASYPPLVTLQPTNRTVVAGDSATFSVGATGAQLLSYQWRLNGTNLDGATASSFTLAHAQSADAGLYSALLSNGAGTVLSSNAVLTVNPPPPCAVPPSGLISWWQAEGNASDVLGTNNGTVVNGATFAPGRVGRAFSLNGVNQYISVPDSPSLRPTNLTVEGWVNFSTLSGGARCIFEKPYGTSAADSFSVVYYAGQLIAAITRASGEGTWLTYNWTPVLGTWHHLAYTFNNASSSQVLYVDGVAVTSGAVTGPIIYDTNPFLIGADIQSGAPCFFFGGLIDEATLFNRALSASEIAGIYSAGATGKCAEPPSIIEQPQSQTVTENSTATFSVVASGTPDLHYQWRFNGTNIPGATTVSLTLPNVQRTSAGLFSVRVANLFGSMTSSNALLTINRAPVAQVADVVTAAGSNCVADASINNGSFDPDGDPFTLSQTPPGPYLLGTNIVTLIVTDNRGGSNSASALVIVLDRTAPALSCPGGQVLEFQDETGAVATYSVTATDTCSTVTLLVAPSSGSLFPIGATPVHVRATDGSSNSTQCSFTVTVLGAQGVKSNVLAELIALRSSVVLTEPFAQKLDAAIQHLADSLNPAYWIDQTHLKPRGGNTAMNEEKLAVSRLHEIMDSKNCPVDPAVLQGFIERIVKCDRLLAVISIQDAARAGLNARKVAEDLAMVAKGDREADAGHYANAIEHYRNAWRHALQLRLQVGLNPDGSTRVQFVGNNSQAYRIEVSADMVNWAPVGTCTADSEGNVEFTDPNAASQPLRLYRAVEQ